jgi:hypothetical protein
LLLASFSWIYLEYEISESNLSFHLSTVKANYSRHFNNMNYAQKQTPWPLVRKQTIPTERSPLVGEI